MFFSRFFVKRIMYLLKLLSFVLMEKIGHFSWFFRGIFKQMYSGCYMDLRALSAAFFLAAFGLPPRLIRHLARTSVSGV